jgi:hypothetical protein
MQLLARLVSISRGCIGKHSVFKAAHTEGVQLRQSTWHQGIYSHNARNIHNFA